MQCLTARSVQEKRDALILRTALWFQRHSEHCPAVAVEPAPPSSATLGVAAAAAPLPSRGTPPARAHRGTAQEGSVPPPSTVAVPGWVRQLPMPAAALRYFRVVTDAEHPEVAQLVRAAMAKLGWLEDAEGGALEPPVPADGGDGEAAARQSACHLWNVLWTWSSRVRAPESELLAWQRVNHFQESRNLTRKDLLKRHLERHAAMFAASRHAAFFGCVPTTFVLPRELAAFTQAFGECEAGV